MCSPLSNGIIFIINALFLIISIYLFLIFPRNEKSEIKDPLKLPYYMAGFLIKGKNSAPDFIISSLIKFIENGNIKIDRNDYINSRGKERINYNIDADNSNNLDKEEKFLYDLIFSLDENISTRKINNLRIKEGIGFNQKFSSYLDILEENAYELNLLYKAIDRKKFFIYVFMAIVDVLVGAVLANMGLYPAYVLIFFGFVLLLSSLKLLGQNPPVGMATYKYYRDFEKELNEKDNFHGDDIYYALAFAMDLEKIRDKDSNIDKYISFIEILKDSLVGKIGF